MSRFENLEFDDQPAPGSRPDATPRATGAPVRDASFFQDTADRQFRQLSFEPALRNYARALERDRARFACWLGQVRCLIELDEYKEAMLWADKALEMFPEHPDLLAAKAVASARTARINRGMAYTDNAIGQKGATPYTWLARAEVLLAQGSDMADYCVSQVLNQCTASHSRSRWCVDMVHVLCRYRRFSQALAHGRQAVQTSPDDAAAWLALGRCQAALGLREARLSLEQAIQLDPACDAARDSLDRLNRRGLWPRVGLWFRRLLGR